MDLCPPEIWHDILWLACTDTGFTGCSISLTSRCFRELSNRVKLRSVALRGVVQIIGFLNVIERTPYPQVENLFISTHNGSGFPEDVVPGIMESLINLYRYKESFDIRVHHPSSVEEIDNDYGELKFHVVMRILSAVTPTLKNLHVICAPHREFILPHVNLPQLVDLVVQGSYESSPLRPGAAPTFNKLRRLRLTDLHTFQGDGTFKTIAASAPNLTHLRLDHRNLYHDTLCSQLKEFLGEVPKQPGTTTARFPVSLEKLFFHPGMLPPPGSFVCGTSMMLQFASMKMLQPLADTDPRFILMKKDPYVPRSEYEVNEGLKAWLGEINGQPSHWEEPTV